MTAEAVGPFRGTRLSALWNVFLISECAAIFVRREKTLETSNEQPDSEIYS